MCVIYTNGIVMRINSNNSYVINVCYGKGIAYCYNTYDHYSIR